MEGKRYNHSVIHMMSLLVVGLTSMLLGKAAAGVPSNSHELIGDLSIFGKEPEVVKGLDLKRYVGRWYEIAKFPFIFEPQDGENTRATYALRADGNIDVLNETFLKGKRISIKGVAYKDDPKSDEAKLRVKFDNLPIIRGYYWVLYVDNDYQYAVVGDPLRFTLFILSKKNKIDDQVHNQLVQKAADQGYDVSKLRKTPQTDPPPY